MKIRSLIIWLGLMLLFSGCSYVPTSNTNDQPVISDEVNFNKDLSRRIISDFIKSNAISSTDRILYFRLDPDTNGHSYYFVTTEKRTDESADRAPQNNWNIYTVNKCSYAALAETIDFNFKALISVPPLSVQESPMGMQKSSRPFYLITAVRSFPTDDSKGLIFLGLQKNEKNEFNWVPLGELKTFETNGTEENGMDIIINHLKVDSILPHLKTISVDEFKHGQ
jgi:hypothetical protein